MKLNAQKSKKYSSYASEKKKRKNIGVILIVVATTLIVAAFYQFLVIDLYVNKTKEMTIKEILGSADYAEVYVINREILKGETITLADVEKLTRPIDMVPDNAVLTIDELKKNVVARVGLAEKTLLTPDMLVSMDEQITDAIKNQDYDWIKVHQFLELGNYVDIHYKAPDGTDTIVASKKKILNLNGDVFAINIAESERAFINNATVKTAVSGGELYTTIYPDPENQNPAEVTYKLDKNIEEQIRKDPNIVNESAETIKDNSTASNENVNVNNNSSSNTTVNKPEFVDKGGN